MINRIVFLAAALLPLSARAQSADATLDRAVAVYARMTSIRAEFDQTLTNPLTGTTATTSGTMLRRKPNLLSISFTNGDHIVADGSNLWLYVPSSVPGQVIRQSARGTATSTFDPAGEFLTSPHSRYTAVAGGKAAAGGRAAHIVTLSPKSASAPFEKVRLWVDDTDNSVRRFEVTDRNGLTRSITITRLTMNPVLPRSAFSFTPPKGVRVVSQPLQQLN
ncbi:MAG: outer membrane lipoprotein carrier protein LolA [Gemmatimonadota bacterium]|nr:outer membrane lipoprotein carrier protein LolA [Gemmatimonadota bacterium]